MKIPIPIIGFPGLSISVEGNLEGVYFVSRFSVPRMPDIITRARLRWLEIVVLAVLLGLGFLAVAFNQSIANSPLVAEWAPNNLRIASLIIALVGLIVGVALAAWKEKQLLMYSVAELIFGTFSIFQIAWRLWPQTNMTQLIGLGSAVYVISRGAGNFSLALRTENVPNRFKIFAVPIPNERLTTLSKELEEETDPSKKTELLSQIQKVLSEISETASSKETRK